MSDSDKNNNTESFSWGDSVFVSKQARTQNLPINRTNYLKPLENKNYKKSLNDGIDEELVEELNRHINKINKEVGKAVNFVEEGIENIINKGSNIVNKGSNIVNKVSIKTINGILRFILSPVKYSRILFKGFISIIKAIFINLGLEKREREDIEYYEEFYNIKEEPVYTYHTAVSKPKVETTKRITLGELARKGIVFLTLKETPIINVEDAYFVTTESSEEELLIKALNEIRMASELAKDLPSPDKGRYCGIPMKDILKSIQDQDLQLFLTFVENHSLPFIQNQFKIAEAYATWIHKGAPLS